MEITDEDSFQDCEEPPSHFESFQSGNHLNPEYVKALLQIDKDIPHFIENFSED